MHASAELQRDWTFGELWAYLDTLPHDVNPHCYEIVDGALVVSPRPDVWHAFACERVQSAIRAVLPARFMIITNLAIEMGRTYRVPDIVVVPVSVLQRRRGVLLPAEVRLVVEVVSPSSVTTDRITKPAQYAAAGMVAYWRVEIDPEPRLTAYLLDPGDVVYTEVGTWGPGEIARPTEPFPVQITVSDLVPSAAPPAP